MKIPTSVRSTYQELLPSYLELKELVDAKFNSFREGRPINFPKELRNAVVVT